MPPIEDMEFNAESHRLVCRLIARLKASGVCEVYPLRKMNEIRIAHYGPNLQKHLRKLKAQGVFARFRPARSGVTYIRGRIRTKLSATNAEEIFQAIVSRRDQVRGRVKVSEKVDPNQPRTVQGGRPESNHSKF